MPPLAFSIGVLILPGLAAIFVAIAITSPGDGRPSPRGKRKVVWALGLLFAGVAVFCAWWTALGFRAMPLGVFLVLMFGPAAVMFAVSAWTCIAHALRSRRSDFVMDAPAPPAPRRSPPRLQ